MFRPAENFKRMNNSAERLCLPQFDVEDAVEYLRKFVEVEKDWVPDQYGTSLYLRPFLFGTDADLALHGISHATFIGDCLRGRQLLQERSGSCGYAD